MGIPELIALALTAIQTVQQLQTDGRTQTTADEMARIKAQLPEEAALEDDLGAPADNNA